MIYRGPEIGFDAYPAADPRDGTRIVRFSQHQAGTLARRERRGTGMGVLVLPGDSSDAALIDPALRQYVRAERLYPPTDLALSAAADDVVDTAAAHGLAIGDKVELLSLVGGTGLSALPVYWVRTVPSSTSLTLASDRALTTQATFTSDITAGAIRKLKTQTGFFLEKGNYAALTGNNQRPLVLTGAGTLGYLAREIMWSHTYVGAAGALSALGGGQDPFDDRFRLWAQGSFAGGDFAGAVLWRMVAEALSYQSGAYTHKHGDGTLHTDTHDDDRLESAIALVTMTFDGFTDSAGNAWTAPSGNFEALVTDPLLDPVMEIMRAGIEIVMDPDTFELNAYNAGTLGSDRTGAGWGAGVVRFTDSTDGTTGTGNITTTARRAITADIRRSAILAGGQDVYAKATDAGASIPWHGGIRSYVEDTDALEVIAGVEIQTRTDAGDVPRIRLLPGDDEDEGLYRGGPGGQFDIYDQATLHSGSGTWHWDELTVDVSAIEYRLREDESGEIDTYVEFGSTFRPLSQAVEFGGPGGGCKCGPTLRLCDAGHLDTTVATGTDWKHTATGSPPAGWHEVGYDDAGASAPVESDQPNYYDTGSGRWIWSALPDGTNQRPAEEEVSFRKEFEVPAAPLGAQLLLAADNGADVYLNGVLVASLGTRYNAANLNHFASASTYSIPASALVEGTNCISIIGWNEEAPTAGSAAVYAELTVTTQGGTALVGSSNRAARCDHKHLHNDTLLRDAADAHPASAVSTSDGSTVQAKLDALEAGSVGGDDVADPITADFSNPPTQLELEAAIGPAGLTAGRAFLAIDSDSGRQYLAYSDGSRYHIAPLVRPPQPDAPSALTASPNGGWTHNSDPHAVGHGGYTYFGYVDGTSSDIEVAIIDATGAVVATRTLRAALTGDGGNPDTHNAPALLVVEPGHQLLAIYSPHNGSAMYRRLSADSLDDDPTLASGFGAESTLDSSLGGTAYTYPNLVQLLDEPGDPIYLFFRDGQAALATGVMCYSKSTDGGSTFGVQTEVFKRANFRPYWEVASDGATRIDIVTSDGRDETGPFALYHLYYEAGAWHRSDGTVITGLPFDTSDLTEIDDSTGGTKIWPLEVAIDSHGRPIVLYELILDASTTSIRYGRWTGTAWATNEIVQVDPFSGGFGGGGTLDPAAPNVAWIIRKVGSRFEAFRYVTLDGGPSWTSEAVTVGSAADNLYPVAVRNGSPDRRVMWLTGTFTSYTDFQVGISGSAGVGASSVDIRDLTRLVTFEDTEANVEAAAASPTERAVAFATDTGRIGWFDGLTWSWSGGGGAQVLYEPLAVDDGAGGFEPVYTADGRFIMVPVGD